MVTPISGFLRRLPLAWLVLATFPDSFPDRVVTSASAKKIGGPVRLAGPKKENKWRYLSKFGYDIGTGSFDFRFQLSAPKSIPEPAVIQLEVYLDEQWAEVESEPVMCDRQRYAKQVRNISIGPGANWTDWSTGTLSQSVRPHIWYFVVSDCRHTLANFTHRLKFEFHAKQANGSEFSVEMKGMLLANALFLGSFIVLMHWFIKRTLAFARSAGYVHPVIWTLASGMITQFIAQVMHTIHLLAYKYDGDGLKACEVLSEILFMLAQVIQTSLLILIALGYTLLQSKIGELDLMIPMCFMIGVIHIMLVGFGKIKDDASYKYHENEGVIGWILLVLRLGLYGWFLWAVQSSAREGGFKIANFLQQFRIAGSLYFLAFPGIFLVTQLFAPYLQHFVMTIGQMFMQTGFNLWLSSLFLTRGEYFKVHLTGGCAALAGCLLLGRRIMCRELEQDDEGRNWMDAEAGKAEELGLGDEDWQRRFDDEARDKLEFQTCSYLQVMGMFTLWVGWYGFNAGSVLSADPSGRLAGLVSWNTTAAGSAAGLGACLYLYGFHLNLDVGFLCNGVLSGLVACTALCDVATPTSSIVIGLLSGLVVYPACSRLMQWARIDDPVDAVAVHAGSGFFGVVATAFCTPPCEKLKMAGTLRGAEAEFCSDEHTLLGQLEMQLWGALLIVCWAFLISMFFFLFCAVCERVKSLELKHVREIQDILAQTDLNGSLSEAADSLLGIRLASVGERSSLVRQLLEQRAQGSLKEMKDFQAALEELRCGWRQSALEPKTSCFVEAMVHLVYACWPLRKIATLRLRIHPSAELSGLGALKAEGGKVYEALHRAAHQIAELRAEHRSVHSPLKRNVKELSLIVKSQDILLRALTRKRSPRRGTGTLQSVAEEDEREKHTPTKPYAGRASAAAEVERPTQPTLHSAFPASSSEPYTIHRVLSDSTLSDDTLSPPMSNSTTPRPSILGRELHRNSSREVNEVADQLSILLQTQQQLMSALVQGAAPIGNPQFAEPPAPQCEPPLMSQRHVLAAALEVLAARGYSGNPSADATPRTLDMMSRGPSSLSLGSAGSAATQRDR